MGKKVIYGSTEPKIALNEENFHKPKRQKKTWLKASAGVRKRPV